MFKSQFWMILFFATGCSVDVPQMDQGADSMQEGAGVGDGNSDPDGEKGSSTPGVGGSGSAACGHDELVDSEDFESCDVWFRACLDAQKGEEDCTTAHLQCLDAASEPGAGSGGFGSEDGSGGDGSGGFGSGGFDSGDGSGGYDSGDGSGGFDSGDGSGGYDSGDGSGGYDSGDGSGGYGSDDGWSCHDEVAACMEHARRAGEKEQTQEMVQLLSRCDELLRRCEEKVETPEGGKAPEDPRAECQAAVEDCLTQLEGCFGSYTRPGRCDEETAYCTALAESCQQGRNPR